MFNSKDEHIILVGRTLGEIKHKTGIIGIYNMKKMS